MSARLPDRRSIRLPWHPYTRGLYWVTLCTWRRRRVLSRVRGGSVSLLPAGRIVADEWLRIAELRPGTWLDAYVIMPDHLHGLVGLGGDRAGPVQRLAAVIGGFKAACTSRFRELVGDPHARLWHRNYYEHVVRSAREVERIRGYVAANPRRWR